MGGQRGQNGDVLTPCKHFQSAQKVGTYVELQSPIPEENDHVPPLSLIPEVALVPVPSLLLCAL